MSASRLKQLKSFFSPSLDAFFLNDPSQIRYYTSLPFTPIAGDTYLLVTPKTSLLFHSPLLNLTPPSHVKLVTLTLINIKKNLSRYSNLGVHSSLPYHLSKQLPSTLTLADKILSKPLVTKSSQEIKSIRHACKITKSAIYWAKEQLIHRPTEADLAQALKTKLFSLGAQALAFEPIVAFGSHTASAHHLSSDRKYHPHDLVLIDAGAQVNGFCADMTRTFLPTSPTPHQLRLSQAVMSAYQAASKLLSGATDFSQIDFKVRNSFKKSGLSKYFIHTSGHGLGLSIHEPPSLYHQNPFPITTNIVFTLEPGLYYRQAGFRHEDTWLTTTDKPQNLTA